jgi:50S ribosomal protein L16 3-hydroxylase
MQELFGDFPLARFIGDYLHRLPFALPDAAKRLQSLGSWETLASMVAAPDVELLIARDGARYDGEAPRDLAAIRRLNQDGWTALIRHAERHNEGLAQLAAEFEAAFRGSVDVHMYVTPAGRHGFSWHYDAEDVFILQTAGAKTYHLRKNTVHPWPLEETLPADMRYEREIMPLSQAVLHAGDMLYIPCGYWHRADADGAAGETSISLAVGVMSRAAIEILDVLRPRLVKSLVWRQRLPFDAASDLRERYRELLLMLAKDISETLTSQEALDAALGEFVERSHAGARR